MTEHDQRIAIAEACGWKHDKDGGVYNPTGEWVGSFYPLVDGLPDYLHDLDAMHEAEKSITNHTSYLIALQQVTGEYSAPFFLVHSTAKQRANAFLTTKGLRKD